MTQETVRAEEDSIPLPPDGGGEKRRPRRDFFGALFLMAISALFIAQALRMPFKDPSWEWYTAPNIFPLAMAVCLAVSALCVAIRGLVGWRQGKASIGPIRWVESAREWGLGRFLAGAVMVALAVSLLGKVNYYLWAFGTIMALGLIFRSHTLARAFRSALIAAVFIVVFLYIISKIFGIVFP